MFYALATVCEYLSGFDWSVWDGFLVPKMQRENNTASAEAALALS